jgi:SnoaL-like protein
MQSAKNAKEIVLSYIKSLDSQDYDTARTYMSDHLPIKGPGETYNTPEELLKVLRKYLGKYNVKKIVAEAEDVCLLYDLTTTTPPLTILMCSWYHVKDGKIDSIQTIFDPRPYASMADQSRR